MKLSKNLLMRSIKMVDIVYISIIYVFLAFYISLFLDKYAYPMFFTNDEKALKSKSTATLILEMAVIAGFIGIIIYLVRNLIHLIPFPLDGVSGYVHLRTKEVSQSGLFAACMIIFSGAFHRRANSIIRAS